MSISKEWTFGVLGAGRFGAKIRDRLESIGRVCWSVGSEADHTSLDVPDWVFIATPTAVHYEQAEHFLRAGANVFVEKPATLDPSALEDLVKLATSFGRRLYIDDVFLYRSDVKAMQSGERVARFAWHKKSSADHVSLLDRLAYHHLYHVHHSSGGELTFDVGDCTTMTPDHIEFEAIVGGVSCQWSYRVSDDTQNCHTIFGVPLGPAPNDALADMLRAVVSESASFEGNHRRALWATKQIARIKRSFAQNVGIVGGGIFGTTIAIELAAQGHNVVLYERNDELLQEASGINQYRVHEGYHYPRSQQTAVECKRSSASFRRAYRQAIIPERAGIKHYYAIASHLSMTSADDFIRFVETLGLPYKVAEKLPGTDIVVEVDEDLFDPAALTSVVKKRLRAGGVDVRLGRAATEHDLEPYDVSIIATYANLNDWSSPVREYQYELCEKPLLRLPDAYRMKSIVILDGPFMCIDPYGASDLHVMGNVVHAIHHRNIGSKPTIPPGYESLLNKGIIRNPSITHIDLFIDSARQFFPGIDDAEHIGSMFTIRTVLPNREVDDARPTLIEWNGNNRLIVFSGKICTAVNGAQTVAKQIEARVRVKDVTRASAD
jgi:hypothetical protein